MPVSWEAWLRLPARFMPEVYNEAYELITSVSCCAERQIPSVSFRSRDRKCMRRKGHPSRNAGNGFVLNIRTFMHVCLLKAIFKVCPSKGYI